LKHLTDLLEGIRAWEVSCKESAPLAKKATTIKREQDTAKNIALLKELKEALESQKAYDIDRILNELMQKPLDSGTKEALEKISDDVLMAEFARAMEIAELLIAANS